MEGGESEVVPYNKKERDGKDESEYATRGSEKDNVIDLTGTERD